MKLDCVRKEIIEYSLIFNIHAHDNSIYNPGIRFISADLNLKGKQRGQSHEDKNHEDKPEIIQPKLYL